MTAILVLAFILPIYSFLYAPHRLTLRYTASHCTAPHCIALHCTTLHRTALHHTTLHLTAPHCISLHCTELYSFSLPYVALHRTALHHCASHPTVTNPMALRQQLSSSVEESTKEMKILTEQLLAIKQGEKLRLIDQKQKGN